MRAHALVLLLLVALVTPAGRVDGEQSSTADAIWDPGNQLVRSGDYAQAAQVFATIADQRQPNTASRALLLEARALLAASDTDTAEALLQQLLSEYPTSDQLAGAYFSLEQVRRTAGDCAGAMRALDAFEAMVGRAAIGPYAAIQRAQCASKSGDWPAELTAAQTALSIDGGGPRLTRIEALERAAEADLKLGRTQDALDFYNRSLSLAGTRAYTAEMLFTTATLAGTVGQDTLAAERFRAIVVDFADQARAPMALDALTDMGRGGTVSPYQAGMVRLNAHDYSTAVSLFDQVDPGSVDWGATQLSRAEALLKLGNDAAGRQALEAVAAEDSVHAGSALLRLGQLQERDGAWADAEATYRRMAQVASPDRVPEALFHVGFARFIGGDAAGALAAWQSGLASGPPAPSMQAQLLYWSARVLPPGESSGQAREALNRAAAADPESYYGLRAQDQLGSGTLAAASAPSTTAWLTPSATELQDRAAWLASLNTTPQDVAREVAVLPGLQRADILLELGLRTEAGWEIDGAVQQYAQGKDIAHMAAIGDWLLAHDLPQLTLRVGRQMRDLVGYANLPRAAQKQVYPAGWGDMVADQAARFGIDPLLMLALIRQESSFDPRAQSSAQAMGLTQVVPATARNIASRLGRDDFSTTDLLKPAVSVEFGTWFMSQMLRDYKGRLFPALAAYDAGGGNVAKWLQRFGDDPDVLVEQIPFAETQTYVRIVYDNYIHYQLLYRN